MITFAFRFLVFGALTLLPLPSWAQASNAFLSGSVTDPTGAAIPQAEVTLTSLDTGIRTSFKTGAEGLYSFNPPVGTYELKVAATGFRDFVQRGIRLNLLEKVRVDIRLELGVAAQALEVHADASPLNFETAEQRAGVAPETLGELPLMVSNGVRSSASFLTLLPGVAAPTGDAHTARISGSPQFAGEVILNSTTLLNPSGAQGMVSATMDYSQSPDMISELKVLQANYEPQYGSTGGAVLIMATKSGTNAFHGSLFEYHRNTALNARQFNRPTRPRDLQNNFGASVGGPFKVPGAWTSWNKTYFFFNWEGFRQRGAPTRPTLSIPSLKQRQGDFSDWVDARGNRIPIYDPLTSRVINGVTVRDQFIGCDGKSPNVICPSRFRDSLALQWFQFLPEPTSPGPLNNFVPTGNGSIWNARTNIYNIRVDEYLGDKDHVTVTVYRRDMPTHTEPRLPPQIAFETDVYKYTWSNHLNWDHIFSPTFLFHFSGAYNHDFYQGGAHNARYADSLPKIPGTPTHAYPPFVSFGDGFTSMGSRYGFPENNKWPAPAFVGKALVTWVRGKHTLKFGFEYRNQRDSWQNSTGEAGSFSFNNLNTGTRDVVSGNSIASFLLGLVNEGGMSYWPHGLISARWGTWIAHVGDTWRVTPNLSVNLGIRWDMNKPSVEQHDVFSFFDPAGPNPAAGNRPGRMVFAGNRWGEYSFGKRYPEDLFIKGFAPRVGIAYTLDQKTVTRIGYGIFYDAGYYPGYEGGINATGFNASYSFSGSADGLQPAFLLTQGLPAPGKLPPFLDAGFANGQSGPIYRPGDSNRKPYSQQWNIGIERQVTTDLHVTASYVGTKGTRLISRLAALNALEPKLLQQHGAKLYDQFRPGVTSLHGVPVPYTGWVEQMKACAPSVAQALLPHPQYCGPLQGISENAGGSIYHSLQVKVESRFRKGFYLLSSYTLSKLLTDTESTQPGASGFSPFERHRAKSLSSADMPHTFSTAFVYDLPIGRDRRWLNQSPWLDYLVGGWRLSSILRFNSGTPFAVGSARCTVPGQFRAACIPGQIPGTNPWAQDKKNFDVDKPLLNVNAFEDANSFNYYWGVGPRLSNLRGFGYRNQDVTLMKRFRVREGITFQIRGDFFNVYNWYSLRGFETRVGSPNFGRWTGAVTAPRYVQVGASVSF